MIVLPHDHGAVLQFEPKNSLTLSTLGASTVILQPTIIDASRKQGFHLIWVKIVGFFSGKTVAEGPILFGICANLNAAELAAILFDDVQDRSGVTKTGPGSWYKVLLSIGVDATEGDITGKVGSTEIQHTSIPDKIPVKWTIPEGEEFSVFALNLDGSALTTGTVIATSLEFFGAWLRD